jgi:hypothetical protein
MKKLKRGWSNYFSSKSLQCLLRFRKKMTEMERTTLLAKITTITTKKKKRRRRMVRIS